MDDEYPPDWPHPRYTRGLLLFENGEHAAAARCFTDAAGAVAAYPPAVIDCLYHAGLAHANADEFGPAAAVLVDGLEILSDYEPDEYSITYLALTGQVFIDLDRSAEAAAYLRCAAEQCLLLSEFEEGAELEYRAGRALAVAGTDPAAAIAAFAAAEDGYLVAGRRNDAAETHAERAELALDADDLTTSRDHLRRALDLFEDGELLGRGSCWFLLATVSIGLGDLDSAEQQFNESRSCAVAMANAGMIADCDDMLAELYNDSGRTEEAAAALAAAIAGYDDEHADKRGDCRARLGAILLDRGDTDAGMELFHAAEADFRAAGLVDRVAAQHVLRGRMARNGDRNVEALELFRSARDLYESLGDEVEMAWCDTLIAGAMVVDRPDEAEQLLDRSGAILAPANREYYLTGRSFLGGVHIQREDLARAGDLLAATRAEATALGLAVPAAECALQLGGIALNSGEYADGLELLDAAYATFVAENMVQQLAMCREFQGLCRNALGDYSAAEHALSEARTGLYRYSTPDMMAFSDMHLGIVYLESGRFAEAMAAFEHARELMLDAGLDDMIPAVEANIGMVFMRLQRYPEAVELLERAERELVARGHVLDAAYCEQNLGSVRLLQGDAVAAIAAFESAGAHFATDPGQRRSVIACTLNLGLAHMAEHRYEKGLECIGRARAGFIEHDMAVNVARCDLLVAAYLFERESGSLHDVIDLGLPGMLYIDHQRLQFAQAPSRVAWAALSADVQRMMFTAVARLGDAELMAELIDVIHNAGVHATGVPNPIENTPVIAELPSTHFAVVRDEAPPAFAPAGALIAGAELPMRPPPLLRLPDGRAALATYIHSANQRYGGIDPEFEIAAW